MNSSSKWINNLLKEHRLNARNKKIIYMTAALVLLVTAVVMRLPASTATAKLICGKEEHTHNDDCYTVEQTLICGQEESEEHVHDDSCYETTEELTCSREEHTHETSCYEQAGSLNAQDGNVNVTVSYDAGVIHDGTIFTVGSLEGQRAESIQTQINDDLKKDNRVSSDIYAYDMYAYLDGNEIQPDGHVDMTMDFVPAVTETENVHWYFYQVNANGQIKDLSSSASITEDATKAVSKVNFQSGAFTTYVLVAAEEIATETTTEEQADVTEENATDVTAAEDSETKETTEKKEDASEVTYPAQSFSKKANGVTVNVVAEEGAFPEGTTMKVTSVKDSEIISEAIQAADTKDAKAKAVDISFNNKDGEEIEPLLPIRVTMQSDVVAKTGDIKVVHINNENKAEVVETISPQDLDKNERPAADEIVFNTDEFSPYVIVYTVDFTFGDYEYHLAGGESIKLSQLLNELQVKKNADGEFLTVTDVQEVSFTDESLVKVTKAGANWILESLEAFSSEEKLTLTLKSGEKVEIEVRDEQQATYTNVIDKELIAGFSVDGAKKNSDNSYTVAAGDTYQINIKFAETTHVGFDMDHDITYQLPSGFLPEGKEKTGTITNQHGTVTFTYVIDNNGKVTIKWPEDKTSEAWSDLIDSQYAEFTLHIEGTFQSNQDQIKFTDTAEGTVNVDNTSDLEVVKHGNYDAATNQINYEVKVTSTGHNSNVNVTDYLEGSAIHFVPGSATASPDKGSFNEENGGFKYHVDSMRDGETITIKYKANVDLNALTETTEDGQKIIGSFDETKNTVTAKSTEKPGGDTDTEEGKDFNNKISRSSIEKKAEGEPQDTDNEFKKIQTWKIYANANANVSMAGKTIKDTITTPDTLKYTGNGIRIIVRDKAGTVIRTDNVNWNTNGLTKNNNSWTYVVPGDDGNYSYEITYDTEVQAKELESVEVKNKAENPYGDEAEGSKTIKPTAGELATEKMVEKVDRDNKEITWIITADIPKTGYNQKFEIWDDLPDTWVAAIGQHVRDTYKEGSLKVLSGLDSNESYVIDNSKANEHKLGIIFYRDKQKTQPGLNPSDKPRTIKVELTTVMDDEVVKAAQNGVVYTKNDEKVHANDRTVEGSSQATVDFTKNPVTKTHERAQDNIVDGKAMPSYHYEIKFNDISDASFGDDDKIVVVDTFEKEYFDWLPHSEPYNTEVKNGYLSGGNQWEPYKKVNRDSKVITKDDDGNLVITLNKNQFPKDENGEYYPVYCVSYYLTVKNEEALAALNKKASEYVGGKYKVVNTITSEEFGNVSDSFDYETDIITKEAENAKYNKDSGNYEVKYTLTLNPEAAQMGDDRTLEVVDTSRNLSIDMQSISATPSLGVSWNRDENGRLIFNIPNGKKVVINYTAKVIGSGEVHYENTAELHGQAKTENGIQNVSSSAEGSSVLYNMNIYKYETGDVMTSLEGVKFNLYILNDGIDGDKDSRYKKPEANDERWEIVNDANKPFVTGSDGHAAIDSRTLASHGSSESEGSHHEGLYRRQWYMLQEVEAPTVNGVKYKKATTPYLFWIDDEGNADYANGVYVNDDDVMISNTPEDETQIGFTVKKKWESSEGLPDQITIRLYQKQDIYASNDSATEYRTMVLNKSDFTGKDVWTGKFENLPKGYAYFIKEDSVEGYTAVYEDENTIGYTRNGTINLSNESNNKEIEIEKVWLDEAGNIQNNPSNDDITGININLLKDGNFYKKYTIQKEDKWKLTITDLEFPGTYTIEEEGISGYQWKTTEYDTAKADGTKSTESIIGSGNVKITNQEIPDEPTPGKTKVKVKKKWVDPDGEEITDKQELRNLNASAEVELVRYKAEQAGTTLHFVYGNNVYTEFADPILVKSNATVKFKIVHTNWAVPSIKLLSYNPSGHWNNEYNNNPDIARTEITPHDITSTYEYTITTDGSKDLYVVADNNGNNLTDVSVEEEYYPDSGNPEIDSSYTGSKITLDKNNNWSASFENLDETGEQDGKTYTYTYGIKEISATDGFTFESYSVGTEKNDSDGKPISKNGTSINVTNKQEEKFTDIDFSKKWNDIEGYNLGTGDNANISLLSKLRVKVQLSRYVDGNLDTSFASTEAGKPFMLDGSSTSGISGGEYGTEEAGKYEETQGTLEQPGTWKFKWSHLPLNGKVDGKSVDYSYEVQELAVYLDAEGINLTEDDLFYKKTSGKVVIENHEFYDITEYFDGRSTGNHEITNYLNTTEFNLTKNWKDISDNKISWKSGESIELTLYADFTPTGESTQTEVQSWKYTITATDEATLNVEKQPADAYEMIAALRSNTSTEYDIKIQGLPLLGSYNGRKGLWSYHLKESDMDDYNTIYKEVDNTGNPLEGATETKESIKNGEVIINQQKGRFELPETGSTGINMYLFSGMFITLISIITILFSLWEKTKPERRRR